MIPYLQVDNLTKSFGDLVLFENISFGIAEGQRIGLIAKNGTGKTTLLNILSGKEGYDSGNIVFRRDLRVDYLEQDPQYPEELTVLEACFHHGNSTVELIKEYERCMETEGHPGLDDLLVRMDHEKAWEYEQKAKQILSQLKIRNFDQQVKHFSGGQLKEGSFGQCFDYRTGFADFGRAYQPSGSRHDRMAGRVSSPYEPQSADGDA